MMTKKEILKNIIANNHYTEDGDIKERESDAKLKKIRIYYCNSHDLSSIGLNICLDKEDEHFSIQLNNNNSIGFNKVSDSILYVNHQNHDYLFVIELKSSSSSYNYTDSIRKFKSDYCKLTYLDNIFKYFYNINEDYDISLFDKQTTVMFIMFYLEGKKTITKFPQNPPQRNFQKLQFTQLEPRVKGLKMFKAPVTNRYSLVSFEQILRQIGHV